MARGLGTKRTHAVVMRLSDEEYDVVRKVAEYHGQETAVFLRQWAINVCQLIAEDLFEEEGDTKSTW